VCPDLPHQSVIAAEAGPGIVALGLGTGGAVSRMSGTMTITLITGANKGLGRESARRLRSGAERFFGPGEHLSAGSGPPDSVEDADRDRDGHAEQAGRSVDRPRAEHGGDRAAGQ